MWYKNITLGTDWKTSWPTETLKDNPFITSVTRSRSLRLPPHKLSTRSRHFLYFKEYKGPTDNSRKVNISYLGKEKAILN